MDKLIEIVAANWLKARSIPFSLMLAVAVFFTVLGLNLGTGNNTVNDGLILHVGIGISVCELIYIALCCWNYRLPKAPKGTFAVLFCIDAETEELYRSAKFKLVDNFNASVDSGANMKALCVRKARIKKYNLQDKADALRLLHRTNCIFVISVRYTADSANSAENFELRINYGVSHPRFNQLGAQVLAHDLAELGKPVGSQWFNKANTIHVFNFTTQTLVFACQYILGVVFLLAGEGEHAVQLLLRAKKVISSNHVYLSDRQGFEKVINDRIFSALCLISAQKMAIFQDTKSEDALREMCTLLSMANVIRPNTYHYNLNIAYAHIILNHDAAAARECINNCKLSQAEKSWLYSDAFLSAYTERSAGMINSKYAKAFKVPYKSLSELVEYIEIVLEKEPQKVSLHFAAGLVYEEMGDYMLMKQHFAYYVSKAKKLDTKMLSLIKGKMQAVSCEKECDSNCLICSA